MANRIQIRRDTATNWTSVNPILASGEHGQETDEYGTNAIKFKIGDGLTAWNDLAYQTYVVGSTAGTLAAGDDARFGDVDIGSLPAASALDGTEELPAVQGVAGVKVTTAELNNHLDNALGYDRKHRRGFQNCTELVAGSSITTGGVLIGSTGFTCYMTGTGAEVVNQGTNSNESLIGLKLGTATTSHCAAFSTMKTGWADTLSFEDSLAWQITTLPSVGNHTLRAGIMLTPASGATIPTTGTAVNGAWFECTPSDADQIYACVYSAGVPTRVATGTTLGSAGTFYITRIRRDWATLTTYFYMNDELVAEIPEATRKPVSSYITPFSGGGLIFKTAGAAQGVLVLRAHSYNYEVNTALVGM